MEQGQKFRVVKEAMPSAEAELANQIHADSGMYTSNWEWDDDGLVLPCGPGIGGIAAALYECWMAYDRAEDTAEQAAADENFHRWALHEAARLASIRRSLLEKVRSVAARVEISIPTEIISSAVAIRRAFASLATRLHGLPHTCLLAARVSTAQAATVASR